MPEKTFSAMSDKDIWTDLKETEEKAKAFKESLLFGALRAKPGWESWCCALWEKIAHEIVFKDGTRIRVHFCPRCGRPI